MLLPCGPAGPLRAVSPLGARRRPGSVATALRRVPWDQRSRRRAVSSKRRESGQGSARSRRRKRSSMAGLAPSSFRLEVDQGENAATAPRCLVQKRREDLDTTVVADAKPTVLSARTVLLGERLDTRGLERKDSLAAAPLTLRLAGEGIAVLF